jgi:hypothetical protein
MLGPAKPRRLDQPIAISLEKLIPRGSLVALPGEPGRLSVVSG